MSARNYSQTLGAGESIRLPSGRFFFVRVASSVIDIETEGNPGAPVRYTGVGAGSKFGPVAEGQGWRFLRVTSAAAQNIEIIISDDGDFDVANTVNVAGSVAITESPSSTIAVTASAALGAASNLDIAANLSRRRITICNASTSAGSVWVRDQSATISAGIELQPGISMEFKTTAALRVRNNAVTSADISTFEET